MTTKSTIPSSPAHSFVAELKVPPATATIKTYSDIHFAKTRSNQAVVGESNRFSSSLKSYTAAVDTTRPRSSSAGRTRSTGTDIVQEIYDRLGLTRGELFQAVSADPKSQRLSNTSSSSNFLMSTSDKNSSDRGRQTSMTSDSNPLQRPRSLSRGRQFRSLWPPTESTSASSSNAKVQAKSTMRCTTAPVLTLSPKPQGGAQSLEDISSVQSPKTRIFRNMPTEHVNAQSPKSISRQRNGVYPKHDSKQNDGPMDTVILDGIDHTPIDGECFINGSSVKERMRAFSEPTKKINKISDAPKLLAVERNHPPLIDIFAEERVRHNAADMAEEKKDDDLEGYSIIKQIHKQNVSKQTPEAEKIPVSPRSCREKGAVLANAFLTAIQTTPTDKVPSSPRTTFSNFRVPDANGDDQVSVPDTVTVSILSSVGSHDEHNNLSPTNQPRGGSNLGMAHSRKPSWLDSRGKRSSASGKVGAALPNSTNQYLLKPVNNSHGDHVLQPASTSAMIERLVDERVQARVADLERRMEEQMRTYMQEIDAKMASRLTLPSDKRDGSS